MPDLRQARKKIKTALAIMVGVDVVAMVVLFSPLVGSTDSRRQELNQLWSELQEKTPQVEPLGNLREKVKSANAQIADFYTKRFAAPQSQIVTQFDRPDARNRVAV